MKKLSSSILAVALALGLLAGCTAPASSASQPASTPVPATSGTESLPPDDNNEEPAPVYSNAGLPEEMRAMWLAYTDMRRVDLSTEDNFRAYLATVLDDCEAMGLNTLFFAVRPFSDAMYASSYFPWSSLLSGTQGVDPGFDPLAIATEETHARGMRIEAYINPYRVKVSAQIPGELSADNPAVENPHWAHEVGASMWYDPGLPEVQTLIINGVREIVENYDVDGIHFDDYFYPAFSTAEEDEAFDAASYELYGAGMDKKAWRRQNVNILVQQVYGAIRELDDTVSFGISPQGNNENNYNQQYSDVNLWLAEPGYVDYVMPQLYWGFNWRSASGADTAAYPVKCAEWSGYARSEAVKLYVGLGAYRIGVGDGGANDQDEWFTGHNIADQIEYARTVNGIDGFGLFSYYYLASEDDPLYREEAAAIGAVNGQ